MSFLYRRPILGGVKVLEGGGLKLKARRWNLHAGSGAAAAAARGGVGAGGALFQALGEADGRAGKIEAGAQTIFKEALVAEVERLGLIGEQNEGGRRSGGLRDVENLHFAAGGRVAALEFTTREPAIQFAGGDAALACFSNAVNQGVKFFHAVARERGKKNHRSVAQELQFLADHGLVIREQLAGISARALPSCFYFARGFFLCGLDREIKLIHAHDYGAA